ncbi:putative licABCH operon regulator [Clostridium putrefaciens]|uniref:Putative licABCH operon regulator n=1 Tax=Clostridium putrefaciens TaxID=99675 RepID=A0A381J4R2_9CLOT|nr:BglG family transcription antiterminator [Clostridium putrefaciens]SUY45938.1 putative licABCH operon regulator [Clostridium putrefaciens]
MIGNIRLQKLIEILTNTNQDITGKELCNVLGVSSRTIRSDIKDLNSILEDKGAMISSKKSKGYKIEVFEENKFNSFLKNINENDDIYNLTGEERAQYIIVKLLTNEIKGIEGITQIELADELYISLSSLKNDIKLAKSILLKIDLDIEKVSNKGIKISGNEESIRGYINGYMLSYNGFLKDVLDLSFKEILGDKEEIFINSILKDNIFKFKYRLSDISYREIVSYIKIILVRNYKNKTINYNESTREKLINDPKFKIAQSICNNIEEEIEIKILDNEVLYLTKHITSSSLIEEDKDRIISTLENEDKLLIDILSYIKDIFNLDFTKDTILINFLGPHIKAAINRAKYGIKIENPMLNLIKNNYPFALEIAIVANSIIKSEQGLNLTEDDIGFMALHFAAALERTKHNNGCTVKNAIIVCTTGVGTSLLLKVKLEAHFKDRLNIIDTIPFYEFNNVTLNNVDLIISTVPLENKCDKVIHIKRLLDSDEIKLIEYKLDYNYSNPNDFIKRFNERLFFIDVEVSDRDSTIDLITNKLIKYNYITEGVKQEIFKREKLAGTQIGNLVAIPHSINEDIKESFIAVAILKKPIQWDNEKVQLVLLIGMSTKDKHNWKPHLEQLYKNIIDINVVEDVIKSTNFEEFKKVVNKFKNI